MHLESPRALCLQEPPVLFGPVRRNGEYPRNREIRIIHPTQIEDNHRMIGTQSDGLGLDDRRYDDGTTRHQNRIRRCLNVLGLILGDLAI